MPPRSHRFQAAIFAPPSATICRRRSKDLSFSEVDNAASAPKCVVTHDDFDWQGDQPLRLPWTSTVIYELHVRGYTIDPSAGVRFPGTYRGLIEKIPYLKALGITAVELMPVQEFNEHDVSRSNPGTGERLKNFWGYDPLGFFAPKASYASVWQGGAQVLEFKEMVRAFHRAGLEVILDVVFNHTGEGDELGPTVSFPRHRQRDLLLAGRTTSATTGTSPAAAKHVNASHPVVRDLILDALRYWVMEMHVDGFRFDLASVLGRDVHGHVVADAPLLERIAEDPILRDAKLIAEAWDAAGAYQVGTFSHRRWAEWNGRFRDDVRRFWRGDAGCWAAFASRICRQLRSVRRVRQGSGVQHQLRHLPRRLHAERPRQLLSGNTTTPMARTIATAPTRISAPTTAWRAKPTTPPSRRSASGRSKTSCLRSLISRGVPMLLGGDEFRRTQRGNNNAYCQDNDTSWVDWSLRHRHDDILRFTRNVLAFRRDHPVLTSKNLLHQRRNPMVRSARPQPGLVRFPFAKSGVLDLWRG